MKRIEDYNKTLPIVELYTAVQSEGRVRATKVEVYEHERNSASYGE